MAPQAVRNNPRLMADEKPEALTAKPDQLLDSTLAERIRASGIVEQVKRGQP